MATEQTFEELLDVINRQQQLIQMIAENLPKIQIGGGGGGTASIEDYQSGKLYKRNMLIVDTNTETVYRVLVPEYTSDTVENDKAAGKIKIVGFESAIQTFSHNPTQAEINALPDDTLVAVYSSNDTPYTPDT
jgi:hypothetical protein